MASRSKWFADVTGQIREAERERRIVAVRPVAQAISTIPGRLDRNRRKDVGAVADADKNPNHSIMTKAVGVERPGADHSFDVGERKQLVGGAAPHASVRRPIVLHASFGQPLARDFHCLAHERYPVGGAESSSSSIRIGRRSSDLLPVHGGRP
jgi:hypothetical protein